MKKLKLNGKLKLNKETVSALNDEQMSNVKGGQLERKGTKFLCGSSRAAATNWPCVCLCR